MTNLPADAATFGGVVAALAHSSGAAATALLLLPLSNVPRPCDELFLLFLLVTETL
jgi:hypothetical protein